MNVVGGIQYLFYSSPQRCAVTFHICVNAEILSCQKNGASMSSHITGYNNGISRFCQLAAYLNALLDLTHSGCCDKHTVNLTFSCHLSISGNNTHSGFFCCFFHGCGDLLQLLHGKTLLNDKSAGKIHRFCSHTGKVINGSADGKLADISPRKKCRRNNKSIGGYCHFSCRRNQHGRIIGCEIRVCKMRFEYFIDQF